MLLPELLYKLHLDMGSFFMLHMPNEAKTMGSDLIPNQLMHSFLRGLGF